MSKIYIIIKNSRGLHQVSARFWFSMSDPIPDWKLCYELQIKTTSEVTCGWQGRNMDEGTKWSVRRGNFREFRKEHEMIAYLGDSICMFRQCWYTDSTKQHESSNTCNSRWSKRQQLATYLAHRHSRKVGIPWRPYGSSSGPSGPPVRDVGAVVLRDPWDLAGRPYQVSHVDVLEVDPA